ncbi:hypothetical protein M0R45_006396 [Rubus argutus]|uniref:Uncharacterized protein n=1 Tax=Rubus argutus TaxID=59490 RepID=A0AAW1YR00_RUBAR
MDPSPPHHRHRSKPATHQRRAQFHRAPQSTSTSLCPVSSAVATVPLQSMSPVDMCFSSARAALVAPSPTTSLALCPDATADPPQSLAAQNQNDEVAKKESNGPKE